MKSQINPLVAAIVIGVVILVLGAVMWKKSQGPHTGPGRMQSNLDMSKMEKDPVKFKQELDDLLKRDREAHSKP